MRKTRDLFKKIRNTKGTFDATMGSIKDRNCMDLTEAEAIKEVARIHRVQFSHSLGLLARASETHARGSPRRGTLRYSSGCLWPNVDSASSLSGTLLVFHLNQVNQPLFSTNFPTTLFFPNLILYF